MNLIWTCPRCNEENGNLNGWCEYCKENDNVTIYNPDRYYIRDIRVYGLSQGDKSMTPQEELFSKLFNHEKTLVKDMETLQLRVHREELAKIAFEARARLTAVDDEEHTRQRVKVTAGPRGFERNLNTDETTTNAINAIKERRKKMSKAEKIQSDLQSTFERAGMSTSEAIAEAERLMRARNISDVVNKVQNTGAPEVAKPETPTENKPFFNPFRKS